VGWFTHTPPSGPQHHHLPVHRQLLKRNESAILLAFHPSLVASSSATAGKLPLTIYESVYEAEASEIGGKTVDVETADTDLKLRFNELPYSIETDQMEMIGMDFIAKGGGNATAIHSTVKEIEGPEGVAERGKGAANRKGKERAAEYHPIEEIATNGKSREDDSNVLGPEDEERVSSLVRHAQDILVAQMLIFTQ
jgi:COP9 signalosome complex subunit 6